MLFALVFMLLFTPLWTSSGADSLRKDASRLSKIVESHLLEQRYCRHVPHWINVSRHLANPRLNGYALKITKEMDERSLAVVLLRGHYEMASYAAMGLGAFGTDDARDALLEALAKRGKTKARQDWTALKCHILNSLAYNADSNAVDRIIEMASSTKDYVAKDFAYKVLMISMAYVPDRADKIADVLKQANRLLTADTKAMASKWDSRNVAKGAVRGIESFLKQWRKVEKPEERALLEKRIAALLEKDIKRLRVDPKT